MIAFASHAIGSGYKRSGGGDITNIVTPDSSNVLALLHMDGTNNSTTFTDSSTYGRTVTLGGFGGGKISSTQSKFGGTSYFTNNQTWLTVGSMPSITGDFTVDFWIYHITRGTTEYDNTVFEYNSYTSGLMFRTGPSIGTSGNSQLYVVTSANKPYSTSSGWFTTGVWQHVAVVRQSGVVKIYVDGNNVTLNTDPWNNTSTVGGGDLRIGAAQHTTGQFIDGYIDEFRVCNIACFTGNFTPLSTAY